MNFPDYNIVSKWGPVVEKHLNLKNRYFNNLVCHYFEFLTIEYGDISDTFLDLKSKIESDRFRFQIVSEHLNILTGRKEFLLSDGTFFDSESYGRILPFDDMVYIFGIEFLKHLDISKVRDNIISKIMDGE
jgi:hypothetical protein